MFIELMDVLRCPRPHEESWLVLSASRMRDRHVMEGELGCHVCQSHFRIRDGVAVFESSPSGGAELASLPPDAGFRMAAMLGLADPGGIVLLVGEHAAHASSLAALVPESQFLCINAARSEHPADDARISYLQAAERLPLASGSCRAAVIDSAHATSAFVVDAIRVVKGQGRLVVPPGTTLPEDVVVLARDSSSIVGERASASGALVPLQSARRK